MTDREKVVELLDYIIQPGEKTLGDIADYFIANGVVVQKHARWIERSGDKFCSECDSASYNRSFNFCPICGAKMDLEVSDEV